MELSHPAVLSTSSHCSEMHLKLPAWSGAVWFGGGERVWGDATLCGRRRTVPQL